MSPTRRYWISAIPAFLLACFLLLLAAWACGATGPGEKATQLAPAEPSSGGGMAAAEVPDLNPPSFSPSPPAPTPPQSPPPLVPPASAPAPASKEVPPPAVSALSAVILDEASATALFDKHGELRLPQASLTKIATAVVAIEEGNPESIVENNVDSRVMRSSTVMGLLPGDRFTLRDLLYGLMLPSGNDAALAIGRHIAGSDAAFVDRMNTLARRLGLHDTHFANPHGLGAAGHYTSARDLAILSRYAMHVPGFAEIVAARSWTARGSRTISLFNINAFLNGYPGADGLKTGYTWRAGNTIVASATRSGHRLYVVLLNSPARDQDAGALMDWAFQNFAWS